MFEPGLFITAEIRVKAEVDLGEAKQAIAAFCQGMNSEPGCSMAVAHQDNSDPRRFILWERYDDEAAFQQHFNAAHTQHFIQLGITELVQAFETNLMNQGDTQ
ncbi:antibiotic biosynthesis monooxygenase [Photobacterium sanctipauli]|uniref:Antibiotic biosynthesis monooxygenase n=2 Tax=Photobacterium sanctipauli TaxID=1342794 RepID=A0A2T3NPB5_9GAMM|nr:antibiotic biosynthesis monooxygenase [Photobacterium sanctipauli]